MKSNFKHLITLCAFLAGIPLWSQQLFPVQVNGVLVPPRALNINVYSTDRSQDLTYFATLVDRDEPFLDVRLRVTIESSGRVIYRTDPNFKGPIINLRQFQPFTIRGSDLAPYLTPSALVGQGDQGQGSVEVPEGFNRICLEVMGVVREVPLSNKFCVQGNFKLNQVPFLIKPVCGSRTVMPVMQNLLFNWRAMHRGSSNNPGPVEYEFTLVELPPGTSNINDAFEASLQVYRTTTTNPSFFYGPSQPRLQADKIYAWRVKAIPSNYRTSKLFKNDGISEVCSFSYYYENPGGGGPGGNTGWPGTTGGGGGGGGTGTQEKDKAPPTGCEVYRTDYGPVTASGPNSIPVVEEDVVKVGYFNMEIRSIAPSGGGYNGSGVIEVPLLNCAVNVDFKNLKVNSSMRVFAADEITAAVDPQYKKNKTQMAGGQMGSTINDRYIKTLDNFFTQGGGLDRMTSGFDPSDPVPVNLPIALDKEDEPLLAIIGMDFTERNAFMTAVAWQPQTQDKYLRFGAVDIPFAPFGTKNKSELKLLEKGEGGVIEVTPALGISFETGRIRGMAIDCNGTQKIEQPAGIKVNEEIFRKSGSNAPFYIDPEMTRDQLVNYVGKLDEINAFTLARYPDIEMTARKADVDFSEEEQLKFNNRFEEYEKPEEEEWKGLVLDEVKVTLPREYDIQGTNKRIELLGGQIIIGKEDLAAGRASRLGRVELKDNFVGEWPWSEDSLYADMGPEQSLRIWNRGLIKTPLFVDTFAYKGEFFKNDSGIVIWEGRPADEVLRMPMWKADFIQDSTSKIRVRRVNFEDRPSEFVPKGEFTGQLLINLRDGEFMEGLTGNKGLTRKTLSETLGVDSLHLVLQGLEIFKLSANIKSPTRYFYTMGEWEQEDLEVKVGNKKFPVKKVDLLFQRATKALPQRLGLKMSFKAEETMVEYTFWSQNVNDQFVFEGIDVYTYYDGPGN